MKGREQIIPPFIRRKGQIIPPFSKGGRGGIIEGIFGEYVVKTEGGELHRIKPRIYVLVWLALVILTGVTVSVAGMNLGRWSVFVVLIIAAIKSGLVLNYFMHLKYEKRIRLFKWMIPGILAVLIL